MALSVLTISPTNNDIDVPLDQTMIVELSHAVDPYSVVNGIALYVKTANLWSGPDLAQLDTKYTDVLDLEEENAYYPLKYQVNGSTLTITPVTSLFPDKEHFITIFPGNDATRYLSKKTVGQPLVIGTNPASAIEIRSSYTGSTDDTFEILVTSSDGNAADTLSVSKGITFVGEFPFAEDQEVDLGELKIVVNGTWQVADTISIPVFKASGLEDVVMIKFTTSKYNITEPRSKKIEFISDIEDPIHVVKTIPSDGSFDNQSCNPITIKFNKAIKPDQDLTDKIKIKRIGFDTGVTKRIMQYYKIEGDTLKIFMISTSQQG